MKKLVLVLISLFISVVSSQASILTVDDDGTADCNNIQEAINAAVGGDIIIISDGIYSGPLNRELNFYGKAVTLQSENGAENCIIDCKEQSRAFNFYSGESNATVIDGFTITNGFEIEGGAIYCTNYSSPTITNCIIQNNTADSWGGGIFCTDYSSPQIVKCTIQNNSALYNYGGGVMSMNFASPTITASTIRHNSSSMYGGGICCYEDGCAAVINSIFTGNVTDYYGGGIMAFFSPNVTTRVTNCTFDKNSAPENGGGIFTYETSSIIANCIFSKNNRNAICVTSELSNDTIESCLFFNNSGPDLDDWAMGTFDGKEQLITHPSVHGASEGDPKYAFDDDYHLTGTSEARDVGNDNPTGGLPDTDKDGNPRILFGGRGRVPRVDVGAYEYNKDVPAIAVSIENLEFIRETGATNPESQVLQIRNCGGKTLSWTIDEDCPWLIVDPCMGNSTTNISDVTISVDTEGMSRGVYTATFSIIDENAFNSPRIIQVTLGIKGTLYVPLEYTSIQDAINEAMEGETIEVDSGIYNESITIDKKLELIGLDSPVINAEPNYMDVVRISADDCVIDGFEITGGSTGLAVYLCNNCTIRNNIISSNDDTGIHISESLNNTISNNEIINNDRGLYISYSGGSVLRQNVMAGNNYNFEIYGDYNQDIDTTNTVNGKSIYYLTGQDNVVIDSSSNAGCLYLIDCSNMTVRGLALSNNGTALTLINTDFSNIEDVNATNNNEGIVLRESGNNHLTNNIVANNNTGITLSYSGSCTLRNNTCNNNQSNFLCQGGSASDYQQDIDTSNTMDGKTIYYLVGQSDIVLDSSNNVGCIYAISCNNITVQDVNITNGEHGVLFVNTSNSSVDNAILTSNNTAGIYMLDSAGCVIRNSDLSNNFYGIYLRNSSNISVENCAINNNNYQGVYCYTGSIDLEDCTVSDNSSYGLYCYNNSTVNMRSCTVNNNSIYGIYSSYSNTVNMESCTINGNSSTGIYCTDLCNLDLTNCVIKNNLGYAIDLEWENNSSINNCTIHGNNGTGIYCFYYNNVTVANSIIWESMPILLNYEDYATVSYCNIQGGYDGIGIIDQLPLLTPDGHLCSDSPCIDKGDPFIPYSEFDIDGEIRSLGGACDIGADEFIDTDSDKLPNFWEDKYFDPNIGAEPEDDPDDDEHTNLNEYVYYSSNPVVPCTVFYVDVNRPGDPNDPNYISDGLSWETAKKHVMLAVALAENSDKIIIAPGIYDGLISTSGKQIIIQSKEPTNPTIVDSTIINGSIVMSNGESRGCMINGLTISNMNENYGLFCGSSSPTINNCNIINNLEGVLCYSASPILNECTIYGNSFSGLRCNNSTPEIQNSVISGNIADMGGGIYCDNSELTIGNSLVTGNASQYEATSISLQESTLNMNQCTVADNFYMAESPAYSSAVYGRRSNFNISNSIIWNNTGSQIRSDYSRANLSYSDIKGGAQGILGYAENHSNINIEPLFAENGYWTILPELGSLDANSYWVEGDYHLKSQGWRRTSFSVHDVNWVHDSLTSRCIDAGNPGSSLAGELLTIPLDSNHDFGENIRVNMGAYGGTNQASMPPHNWALSGDLNNDGTIDFTDMAQWSGSSFPEGIDNPSDLNRNKTVDMTDLMMLTQDWLKRTSWF